MSTREGLSSTRPACLVIPAVEAAPTAERSALMARIRVKDTTPEIVVRRVAHGLGLRFRLHRRDLPGTPDLVLPKYRLAVFVHGCFWHRHEGCRRCSTPKTRAGFWTEKFKKNVERDERDAAALRIAGWDVLTIWECETKNLEGLQALLRAITCGPIVAASRSQLQAVLETGSRSTSNKQRVRSAARRSPPRTSR